MVNPNKHANNLNEDDLEKIYNRLEQQYENTEDYHSRKMINQQKIAFILSCKRFSPSDMVRIPYSFFQKIERDDVLYEPVTTHIENQYCKHDGLLLTDKDNNPYEADDIDILLSKIEKGKLEKTISVETLNKTKSRFNNYGHTGTNKHKLREYLKFKIDMGLNMTAKEDNIVENKEENDYDGLTDKLAEKLRQKVKSDIDSITSADDYSKQLSEIMEKQDILQDSLANKFNQLSNTVNKVHQKVKSSNAKYTQLNNEIHQLNQIKDLRNSIGQLDEKQDTKLEQLERKVEKLTQMIDEMSDYNKTTKIEQVQPDNDNMLSQSDYLDNNQMYDYKQFMYNWFNRNMRVTRSPHDTVDLSKIEDKLSKDLEKDGYNAIEKDILFERLENYLHYWYNTQNPPMKFKDIKTTSINGNEFLSNIKFINLKQERENTIKNTIITWLKEHTVEMENTKTYTKDILLQIKPIFEEIGWIITDNEQWKQLHDAGYTKICPKRTFSQIIGKAVQEVYISINKNTIQRDTPNDEGYITWYPNIQIVDKKLSDNVHSKMKDELSSEIFESDNIIMKWFKQNIKYTANTNDRISSNRILQRLVKYLQVHDICLSKENLDTMYINNLETFLKQYNTLIGDEISGFVLERNADDKIEQIMLNWVENHLEHTGNAEDILYIEDVQEKVLHTLLEEKITVTEDDIYSQLPEALHRNFITKTLYQQTLDQILYNHFKTEQKDSVQGYFVEGWKINKYHTLTSDIIRDWIEENIVIIKQQIIFNQKVLYEDFEDYLKANSIRNTQEIAVESLLDEELNKFYQDKTGSKLQVLQDNASLTQFYVGIEYATS